MRLFRGRRRLLALAAGTALALLARPRALAADDEVVEGKRVVVTAPAGLRAVAEAARDALEGAIPVYEEALPYRLPAQARLSLRLCASAAEYRAIVERSGAPDLVETLAATLWHTAESVVAIVPRPDDPLLALTGALPDMTRFLVCHEGVHQFLLKSGATREEWWPSWYSEGIADHLAAECLLRSRGKDAPAPVLLDDRAHLVRETMLAGKALPLPRLLRASATSVESPRSLYAQTWSLMRFLSGDAARFRDLHERVKALSDLPQGDRSARLVAAEGKFAAALEAAYGPLPALEARWRAAAGSVRLSWFEPMRASEVLPGNRVVCAAYPGEAAMLVSAAPPPSGPFSLSCTVTILGGKQRQADLVFGFERRDAPRYVKLALGSEGFVSLLVFSDGRWQKRYQVDATVPAGLFAEGQPVPVRAVVKDGRISLFVRGESTFEAAVPATFDAEHGSFGVGAQDSVVLFEGLSASPLAK